ncbi:hypothetical protein MMC17_009837 [Xylographa soralifera]|nr:hypothetical protein [Xylographa soralifera]
MSQPSLRDQDQTLHLPRILCLHGGGSNARIFRTQCRVLRARLAPYFRLIFVDAPYFSGPGPDVVSVYAECGPFRSWILPKHSGRALVTPTSRGPVPAQVILGCADTDSVDRSIQAAMQQDDRTGATGRWVGLLGFSQGAKLAASMLLRQQTEDEGNDRRESLNRQGTHSTTAPKRMGTWLRRREYRFAVLLAGRAPLNILVPDTPESSLKHSTADEPLLLRLPTIHVHGLRDPGISMHRDLLDHCCEKGSTRLVEWDGDHRVPIKTKDTAVVVAIILDVAREAAILNG